jgi:DNA-directed RNA polymerase specialized sigma24 family protein
LEGVRQSSDRTDAELIREAESDAGAFGELYRRHVAAYGWFRRRLEWAASDLSAETFAQAWLPRPSFRDGAGGSATNSER